MNSLSWMIYFAGVVGALGAWLLALGIISVVGEPLRAFFATFDEYAEPHPRSMKIKWPIIWTGLAMALGSSFIPSQGTVYAIAASEMGEHALNTATGGKAVRALNAWLDRQIAEKPDSDK